MRGTRLRVLRPHPMAICTLSVPVSLSRPLWIDPSLYRNSLSNKSRGGESRRPECGKGHDSERRKREVFDCECEWMNVERLAPTCKLSVSVILLLLLLLLLLFGTERRRLSWDSRVVNLRSVAKTVNGRFGFAAVVAVAAVVVVVVVVELTGWVVKQFSHNRDVARRKNALSNATCPTWPPLPPGLVKWYKREGDLNARAVFLHICKGIAATRRWVEVAQKKLKLIPCLHSELLVLNPSTGGHMHISFTSNFHRACAAISVVKAGRLTTWSASQDAD